MYRVAALDELTQVVLAPPSELAPQPLVDRLKELATAVLAHGIALGSDQSDRSDRLDRSTQVRDAFALTNAGRAIADVAQALQGELDRDDLAPFLRHDTVETLMRVVVPEGPGDRIAAELAQQSETLRLDLGLAMARDVLRYDGASIDEIFAAYAPVTERFDPTSTSALSGDHRATAEVRVVIDIAAQLLREARGREASGDYVRAARETLHRVSPTTVLSLDNLGAWGGLYAAAVAGVDAQVAGTWTIPELPDSTEPEVRHAVALVEAAVACERSDADRATRVLDDPAFDGIHQAIPARRAILEAEIWREAGGDERARNIVSGLRPRSPVDAREIIDSSTVLELGGERAVLAAFDQRITHVAGRFARLDDFRRRDERRIGVSEPSPLASGERAEFDRRQLSGLLDRGIELARRVGDTELALRWTMQRAAVSRLGLEPNRTSFDR